MAQGNEEVPKRCIEEREVILRGQREKEYEECGMKTWLRHGEKIKMKKGKGGGRHMEQEREQRDLRFEIQRQSLSRNKIEEQEKQTSSPLSMSKD